MKRYWDAVALRVDALSLRERAMVFAAMVALLVVGMNTWLIKPQLANEKRVVQQLVQDRTTIEAIRRQIDQLRERVDPNAERRAQMESLKSEIAHVKQSIQDVHKGLVAPERMPALLQDMLSRSPTLRLVSLRTLPTQSFNAATSTSNVSVAGAADKSASQQPGEGALVQAVFRHGVEVVVQGSYFDMLQYLAQLESMPWQVYWGKAELKTDEYPRSTLTLHLYTLSLERSWLNL